jgi:hypothetical protein
VFPGAHVFVGLLAVHAVASSTIQDLMAG